MKRHVRAEEGSKERRKEVKRKEGKMQGDNKRIKKTRNKDNT